MEINQNISKNKRQKTNDEEDNDSDSQILARSSKKKMVSEYYMQLVEQIQKFRPSLVTNEFELITNLGLKSYKFHIEEQKTGVFEIEKKMIAYHPLDELRFSSEEKILMFGFIEKLNKIIEDCRKLIISNEQQILYCRGSSGIGKTFALTLSTLIMKSNYVEKLRIIHVLLKQNYLDSFCTYFLQDLIYAFSLDKDEEIGQIPNSRTKSTLNEWYEYLKIKPFNIENYILFLEFYIKHYNKKNIKILMIWDGDNYFHKYIKLFRMVLNLIL